MKNQEKLKKAYGYLVNIFSYLFLACSIYLLFFEKSKDFPSRLSFVELLHANELAGVKRLKNYFPDNDKPLPMRAKYRRLKFPEIQILYNSDFLSTQEKMNIMTNQYGSHAEENELFASLFNCYLDEMPIVKEAKILDVNVEVKGQTLVFKNIDVFNSLMSRIVNRSFDDIVKWEDEIGFKSLRRKRDKIDSFKKINKRYVLNSRTADAYFESVLSEQERIIIGDTLFQFDINGEYVDAINIATKDSVTVRHDYRHKYRSKDCNLGSQSNTDLVCLGESKDEDCIALNGKVWSQFYYLYASLGASVNSYESTPNGDYKKYISPSLSLTQDHYDRYSFAYCNSNTWQGDIKHQVHRVNNSSRCLKVFEHKSGYNTESFSLIDPGTVFFFYGDHWDEKTSASLSIRKKSTN